MKSCKAFNDFAAGRVALVLLLCIGAADVQLRGQDDAPADAPIAGLPKGWLIVMRTRAGDYLNFAKSSFTLDEGQVGLLLKELDDRIYDQWEAEQALINNPPPLPKENSDAEAQRYAQALQDAYDAMPMNAQQVLNWIVEILADKDEVWEGRQRFTELCHRLDRKNKARSEGPAERVALGQLIKQGRARTVFESRDGLIDPSGHIAASSKPFGIDVRLPSFRGAEVDRSPINSNPKDLPPPLPCMKDFDRWKPTTSRSDSRTPAARLDLYHQMHFRTWRVIATDPELYHQVLEANSDSEIENMIKVVGLDKPIDAILHEMSCNIAAHQ